MDIIPQTEPLVPDLLAAANAAGNLMHRSQWAAGGHLMDAYSDFRFSIDVHRGLAERHAEEANAARLEWRDLYAAYRAGGVS